MLSRIPKKVFNLRFLNDVTSIRFYASQILPLKYKIPLLNETLEKYTKYLKPLVSENEFEHTRELIKKFIKQNGEGEILQKLLEERAEKKENWLSEWWTNVAYLDGRDPIVINSNPGVRLPIENFKNTDDWITFSVNFLTSVLKYKLLIDSDKVPRDYLKHEPLCMNQYYTLFNTCRVPGKRKDEIFTAKSHLLQKHERIGYITVVHKNRFFVMDVIDPNTQMIYSKKSLIQGFSTILDMSQTHAPPIGLMTAENRNVWGTCFSRLQEVPSNRESFYLIQKSILLFCLDSPVFLKEFSNENPDSLVARNMLHGGGYQFNSANRWFDKTLQIIISSDGACGINYEHTPAEAPPLINIIDYVYKNMGTVSDASVSDNKSDTCRIKQLEFSLNNKAMEDIDASKSNITSLVNDLELHAIKFDEFGKTKIKGYKTSPDAFIQIGIQLGYYNLHNRPGSTYESGSLRRFRLGRTDTIRTCSSELVDFCKSVNDPGVSTASKKQLLLKSVDRHVNYTKEVLNGKGIDRHLLGLKLIAIENRRNIPDLFMDTSFSKATHHVLSTSQGSSSVDLTMCYGPLVPDGYGFCYNPRPDQIHFCVSAVNSSPETNALSLSRHITDAWKCIINILQT